MRKYTDAKKAGNKKWDSANLDRISVALPKGRKAEIQAAADELGESVNGYISAAINDRMAEFDSRQARASADAQDEKEAGK